MTPEEKDLYRCLEFEQMMMTSSTATGSSRRVVNKEVGVKITVKQKEPSNVE